MSTVPRKKHCPDHQPELSHAPRNQSASSQECYRTLESYERLTGGRDFKPANRHGLDQRRVVTTTAVEVQDDQRLNSEAELNSALRQRGNMYVEERPSREQRQQSCHVYKEYGQMCNGYSGVMSRDQIRATLDVKGSIDGTVQEHVVRTVKPNYDFTPQWRDPRPTSKEHVVEVTHQAFENGRYNIQQEEKTNTVSRQATTAKPMTSGEAWLEIYFLKAEIAALEEAKKTVDTVTNLSEKAAKEI